MRARCAPRLAQPGGNRDRARDGGGGRAGGPVPLEGGDVGQRVLHVPCGGGVLRVFGHQRLANRQRLAIVGERGWGWVLEALTASTLQLRMTTTAAFDFGIVYPTSCTGGSRVGIATMVSIHRMALAPGDVLSAPCCSEGSTMDITVNTSAGSSLVIFRCQKYALNANVCQRLY